ncbi:hypothetical protein AK812_SmicGene47720, partial [Symbiodinium microadriaticum]
VEALQKQLQTKLSETDVLPAKPEETAQQGQFKGCQQGSQERVEDLGRHEVQCDVFEQRDKQEPGAEEVERKLVVLIERLEQAAQEQPQGGGVADDSQ